MQNVRTQIRKVVFLVINFLFKFKYPRSIINIIYNNCSWENKRIITTHLINPNINFIWKIKLLNGKYLKMQVEKDKIETFNLAFLYHNISPQLCILENDIEQLLDNESYYFDIGANQGMRSYLMLVQKRKTFMFEPNNFLNNINKQRCDLNEFYNYKIEAICISDSVGKQDFYFSNEPSMSSLNKSFSEVNGVSRVEKVNINTLDNYIKVNGINSMYPLIKIDVEGHEISVISGAKETIKTLKPTLIIEIFELNHVKEIFNFVKPLGYEVFGINFGSKDILTQIKTIDFLNSYKASDYLFVYQKDIIDGLKIKYF